MQSHLGRLTVDTNAARSHHSRAISEPTIDRPQFEEPVLVPSNGNSLRPRSTSNYAAAAESPRLNLSEHASPYQLTSSSIAHLSPAAHSILINGAHQEDVQAHSPVPFSPVADDSFQHSPVYPAPSNKAWSLYQGNGDKHDRPSQADLEFRPRSAVSEPGRDIHDHSEQRSNMRYATPSPFPPGPPRWRSRELTCMRHSAFEYMFPAGVGHFSQGPHYDTVLQSSFQGKTDPSNDGRFAEDADSSAVPPDYNSIPVPEVPHLDQAPRSSIETDEDRYYNRPMSASPAASLPSPHQSPVDHEIMRQRRQYHQSRRLAKSQSRARSQGSPSSSYFPEQARGRDVGLGIHMSPEPGMTPPPTSAHYSQQGMPTLIEGYHHDSRATTPTHPSYLEHYAHSPTGNGSFEMPMNMPMPTSHPIYQP